MSEEVPPKFRGPKASAVLRAATGRWATFAQVVQDSGVGRQSVKWYLSDMVSIGIVRRADNMTDFRGRYVYRTTGT